MLRYLLDTNIVIYLLKRRSIEVLQVFNQQAHHMAISVITFAELVHGAEKCSKPTENLAVVEDFCSRLEGLTYTPKATKHYGMIRASLEKMCEPIDVNDLHTAAHARSEGPILVTNNLKEFLEVPALQLENWVNT